MQLIFDFDFFGFILIFLMFIACCISSAATKMSEELDNRGRRSSDTDELPHYMKREMSRTSSHRQQRKFYTSEEMRVEKKPISGYSASIGRPGSTTVSASRPKSSSAQTVQAKRGGEFIGNRMRFKVKVLNESPFIITDVRVFLISYPSTALKLASDDDVEIFAKIEPSGFRSPTFDFMPTQDCVKGEIIAGVSYIDERGQAHTLTTKPFIIRSVCDLLIPDQITPDEFTLKLKDHECGEIAVKVIEWSPEEMFEKSLRIIGEANFYEVESKSSVEDGVFSGEILGLGKGKYTGKSVGVKILVSGPTKVQGASCTIQVTGEDKAMILPAIDDLRERLSAWLCPLCGSPLTIESVEELRAGRVVKCPFCSVTIGR